MIIDEIIERALEEDLGDGDFTSLATIPENATGKAQLLIKEDGILAGVNIAKKIFQKVDKNIKFRILLKDGTKVKKGDIVFTVEGKSISILSAERLALNFMQRLSGIATATNKIVSQLKGLKTKVLDTRKTTPNLRLLEKEAVKTGGGENHRMGLYDMIMIKDNHIDFAGGIKQAINAAKNYLKKNNKKLKIEIEVRNFDELNQVIECGGVDRIMLDNFSPEDLKKAIKIINGKYETEASGGITINNIRKYAESGVDFISVGALTHHIKSLDMSLKAIK
ncbi:MAG: carboxylating nicotinate-nucleotide diphosphorylase [Bacteroidales bacterium]|nr:carboxylating nicotinate-nucleotide diphosphorylase [Bacteroidales bacterium]